MPSMRRALGGAVGLGLLACVCAFPLYGQGPRLPSPLPVSRHLVQPPRFAPVTDSSARKRTYWVEGGVIGAVGGLLLAQLYNSLVCEGPDCGANRRVFVMVVGGFVVGSLIGGGF